MLIVETHQAQPWPDTLDWEARAGEAAAAALKLTPYAALAQVVDQAIAHALAGQAHAEVGRLQAHPRDHDAASSDAASPPTQLATCSSAWYRVRST